MYTYRVYLTTGAHIDVKADEAMLVPISPQAPTSWQVPTAGGIVVNHAIEFRGSDPERFVFINNNFIAAVVQLDD